MEDRINLIQLYSKIDKEFEEKFASPLHLFLTLSNLTPEKLPSTALQAGVELKMEPLGQNIYEVTLLLRRRMSRGYLVVQNAIFTFLIRSDGSSIAASEVTSRWLVRLFPEVSRMYLESRQLLDLLNLLNSVEQEHELQIIDYMLYKQHKSTARTWEKGKRYDRRVLERETEKNKAILDSIHFEFAVDKFTFDARVSRKGHFTFYKGKFSDFNRLVVIPSLEMGIKNQERFSERQRKVVQGEAEAKPLRFKGKFEKNDLYLLSDLLKKVYSVAVLRKGNPWLLIQTIDQNDGSSFDIYGYEDEIVVVPFAKASSASFLNLYSLIIEAFPTARVNDEEEG